MDLENTPDFVTTILNVGTHFADDEALKALYSAYGSTNIPEEFAIVRNEDGSYDVIRADEVDEPLHRRHRASFHGRRSRHTRTCGRR